MSAVATLVLLAPFVNFTALADASTAGVRPPDPTVTDPDKYRVILDNDEVRVIDYRDRPGDSTKPHHHKPFVLYVLSPFKRKLTFPDGTTKEREFKTGEVFWMDEQTHVGQNVGTTESHALIVEPKKAAKAAPAGKAAGRQPGAKLESKPDSKPETKPETKSETKSGAK